jgi:zinc transporter
MMLSHDRHQQLHAAGSFVYGILADLVCEVHGISDELGYLRFIMTEQLLMTGRHHSLAAVEATRATIQSGATRLTHCASLLELIVEHLADGIDDIADDLAAKLDEIEDQLAVRSIGLARRNLAGVRRTSVRLHRHLSGLRAVLNRLERQGVQTLDPRLQLRVGRLVQRLDELDRAILEIRERGYRLQDEVSATITEETNRHLHLLSILTALLLPPTLVAGVFGMNTKGLPLTEQNSGFVWAMVLVVGSSVVAYIVLRLIGILKPRE